MTSLDPGDRQREAVPAERERDDVHRPAVSRIGAVRTLDVGSVKWKRLPPPGAGSTQMRPWWRSTTVLQTVRPMPLPGTSSSLCRRWPKSNTRSAYSGSIPMPLSVTVNSHSASPGRAAMAISGGSSPRNLTALAIRFWNSWASWTACAGSRGSAPTRTSRAGGLQVGRERGEHPVDHGAAVDLGQLVLAAADARVLADAVEQRRHAVHAADEVLEQLALLGVELSPDSGARGSARSPRSRAAATAGRATRRPRSGPGRRWSGRARRRGGRRPRSARRRSVRSSTQASQ